MKTVAVFPSKSSSSEAVSPFPQLKKPQLENKQEKIVEVKVWKPDVHEFTSTSIIEPEASLLDFKLSPFPQRPALKKQDTSVIPDHILLQRLRTKKPDIVFNDSPTKSEYHSASPTTNTRVNSSNQASERNRSPDSSRVDVLPVVDSSIDAFVFSSPQPQQIPSPNQNAAGGQKRINPVLSISPYPAPSSPPRILDASSHATFGNSTEKLKVAGFTIANYAADSSGSKRQHASSSENCTNQEIRNLQGSKVLKVSIPKAAMNTPDREHDGDHRQYVAELASELNNVLISPPISAVDKPVVPAAAINSKGRQELKAPPKPIPVAGQINSPPKAAEIHTVVFSEREDGDGAAFKSHSLADDYLMQLRFHSNFKLDKEKDALRGAGKAVRMAEPQRLAPQVSCQLQELVLPSMPIKPKPQTSFMSVAARRHLALRVGVPAQPASSIKSPSAHSGGAPLPEGNSTAAGSDMLMLKRRVVNDALSGARTGATKGGLFQSAENVDFYDLLNGSASVSVSAEQSRNAHLAHELELQKEREREKILAGEAEAAVKLSCQSNLDPAVQAAIRAAQSVNASLNLLPRALSPLSALDGHAHLLTADEKVEIMAFPKVYFLGQSRDLKPQNVSELDLNGGYDSTGGQYLVAVGDHLRYRYEVLGSLGKGSFGDVFRCRDHKSGIDVAVKVIKNQPIFNAQAEKELAVLNLIRSSDAEAMSLAELGEVPDSKAAATCIDSRADRRQHRHMIQLVDSFEFRHHKCFVFPVCGMNLYEYLKAKDFNGLPMSFVRKVAAQLLDALTHMRSLNVIHCDIKPENILLRNEQCASVVLIDFGSSCIAGQSSFTYIQSRFYRSPEVLLGLPYSKPFGFLWNNGLPSYSLSQILF